MISPTAERPLSRVIQAAPRPSARENESAESSRSRLDAPRPERYDASLLNLLRQRAPTAPSTSATLAEPPRDVDPPPLDLDVLRAAAAHDAMRRSRQLGDAMNGLNASDATGPDEETLRSLLRTVQALPPLLQERSDRLRAQQVGDEGRQASGRSGRAEDPGLNASSNDFLDDIFALMERLDKEWLTRFSDILGNYVAFFNKLTEIMAKMAHIIQEVNGAGNFHVWTHPVHTALAELKKEVENGLGLGGDFATEGEAKAFLEELGLEDLTYRQKADGTYELVIDTRVIDTLHDLIPQSPDDNWFVMSPAAHAALLSAKDSLMERFNHINRVLPDKYQRQLQMWDTLVKTLSGTIDSMADTNKLIMQNMA